MISDAPLSQGVSKIIGEICLTIGGFDQFEDFLYWYQLCKPLRQFRLPPQILPLKLKTGQYLRVDHSTDIGLDLLVATRIRESVEVHVLAAGIENGILLHPGQRIVPLLFLCIPTHLYLREIGQKFHNGVADGSSESIIVMKKPVSILISSAISCVSKKRRKRSRNQFPRSS